MNGPHEVPCKEAPRSATVELDRIALATLRLERALVRHRLQLERGSRWNVPPSQQKQDKQPK